MKETIIFFALLILTAVSLSSLAVNWQQYNAKQGLEEKIISLQQTVDEQNETLAQIRAYVTALEEKTSGVGGTTLNEVGEGLFRFFVPGAAP